MALGDAQQSCCCCQTEASFGCGQPYCTHAFRDLPKHKSAQRPRPEPDRAPARARAHRLHYRQFGQANILPCRVDAADAVCGAGGMSVADPTITLVHPDLISFSWWDNKEISNSERLAAIASATAAELLQTSQVRRALQTCMILLLSLSSPLLAPRPPSPHAEPLRRAARPPRACSWVARFSSAAPEAAGAQEEPSSPGAAPSHHHCARSRDRVIAPPLSAFARAATQGGQTSLHLAIQYKASERESDEVILALLEKAPEAAKMRNKVRFAAPRHAASAHLVRGIHRLPRTRPSLSPHRATAHLCTSPA